MFDICETICIAASSLCHYIPCMDHQLNMHNELKCRFQNWRCATINMFKFQHCDYTLNYVYLL